MSYIRTTNKALTLSLLFCLATMATTAAQSAERIVRVSSGSDGFFVTDNARQWLSGDCVGQLAQAGIERQPETWSNIASLPIASPRISCAEVQLSLMPTLIVTLVSENGDGFLLRPDNSRQWLRAACITQLRNAGVTLSRNTWSEISARNIYPRPQSCNDIQFQLTGDNGGTIDASQITCNSSVADIRAAFLQVTNASRAQNRQCGGVNYPAAGALQWDDRLARAAQRHSQDMATNNFFDHGGSDGSRIGDRASDAGYRYGYVGENIAAGYSNVARVQSALMDSAGHCRNIMREQFVHIGAYCIWNQDTRYRSYWTIVFGQPRGN